MGGKRNGQGGGKLIAKHLPDAPRGGFGLGVLGDAVADDLAWLLHNFWRYNFILCA